MLRNSLILCGLLVAACRVPTHGPNVSVPDGRVVRSNVARPDYAGSEACQGCHQAIYDRWAASPMHQMTRQPAGARIRAPFDGRQWRFKDDTATFESLGPERFVRLQSTHFGNHLFRITHVIGGRYREDYAGLEVATTAPDAPLLGDAAAEMLLPVSYIFETQSFRLKGYSVMVGERPGLRAGGVWNQTCVFCHNTVPYLDTVLGALAGPGAPPFQGSVVDRLLPEERRVRYQITDRPALEQALADEIAFVGGQVSRGPVVGQAMATLRSRITPAHFVDLGVGCESCHGGSAEHVRRTAIVPTFEPRSPFLTVQAANGTALPRVGWMNRACARCHQVLFSRYPYTWEGGLRRGEPGGSHITSGEGRDFLLGGCAQQMACTTCHDPHGADQPAHLQQLATPAGNSVCLGCHQKLASLPAQRAHSHHDPAGAGGACLGCHMPRKNMGLGYALTRYHRIGSPNEVTRVEKDRPLECALCHGAQSPLQLVQTMEQWWGKRYDRGALARLYGDLSRPTLIATMEHGKPHEQATALALLGEQRMPEGPAWLAGALTHPYPLVRLYAQKGLTAMLGKPCPVNLDGPTEEIAAAARRCVPGAHLFAAPPTARSGDDDE